MVETGSFRRTSGIPESKLDVFLIDFNVCNIVLKHRGHVDLAGGEWEDS
jgi:hypothetical protein